MGENRCSTPSKSTLYSRIEQEDLYDEFVSRLHTPNHSPKVRGIKFDDTDFITGHIVFEKRKLEDITYVMRFPPNLDNEIEGVELQEEDSGYHNCAFYFCTPDVPKHAIEEVPCQSSTNKLHLKHHKEFLQRQNEYRCLQKEFYAFRKNRLQAKISGAPQTNGYYTEGYIQEQFRVEN